MIKNLVFSKTSATAKHPNVSFFLSVKDGKKYYSYVVRNAMNTAGNESSTNKNARILDTNTMKNEKSFEMENVVMSFVSFELLRSSIYSKFGLFAVLENGKLGVCPATSLDKVNGIFRPKEGTVFNSLEELADEAYGNPDTEITGTGYIQFVQSYFDESGLDGLKFQQLKTENGETIVRDVKTGLWRTLGAKDKKTADEMEVFRAWQILTERAEHKIWTPRSLALTQQNVSAPVEVSEESLQSDPQPEIVEGL